MFDRGRRTTRFDLHGHAVIHTAPNVQQVERSAEAPAGYAPVCIGTTTSQRMERFTRPLMERERRAHHHRQGRPGAGARSAPSPSSAASISRSSAAPPRSRRRGSKQIEDVDLDDLNPESVWQFRVRDFGPLLVAMDSHGGSLYSVVADDAQARRAKVLAGLGVKP